MEDHMSKFKIYLAGAIEKTKDGGKWIRKSVRKALEEIPDIEVIDPCDFELNQQCKTLREVVKTERNWKSKVRQVLNDDIDVVESVNLVVAILNKSVGSGTTSEAVASFRKGTPVLGYYTSEDVYNDRADCIYPWLLAALDKECVDDLERLKRLVVSYMKA
jgi:nucleoside 2-deoxyribosyltransferase